MMTQEEWRLELEQGHDVLFGELGQRVWKNEGGLKKKLARSYIPLVAPRSPSQSSSRQHTPNPPVETPPPSPLPPLPAQLASLWRLKSPRQSPETDNEDFITNLI